MEEEIQALRQNETWNLAPKPRDVKPISCKWVYKVKTRPNGSVEKYKARLITHELSQKYELDYDEMFKSNMFEIFLDSIRRKHKFLRPWGGPCVQIKSR